MDTLTVTSERLIHLDMKGAPLKLDYLGKLFPLLREWGATGLLIEWEDTFPYTSDLRNIGSLSIRNESISNLYNIEEVNQILDLAASNYLNVIPLVQTFGHLEFLLKHERWQGLREVENYPSSMCPSHVEALPVVRKMVTQILKMHSNIQYIHIGADEVWHLGLCVNCKRRIQNSKHGRDALFLEHVVNVAQFIRELYPNIKVIMWDDMLRTIDVSVLQEYQLGSLVEPMIWHYNSRESFMLGSDIWDKYSNLFKNVWIATAFKGATGCAQTLPIIQKHISNHEGWLSNLNGNVGKIENFRGCAFTGWSRYDHYAILCELLPCALPSLAVCLKVWLNGGFTTQILESVNKALGFTYPALTLDVPTRPCLIPNELLFPGWQVYVAVEWFVNVKCKYRNFIDSEQMEAWFNDSQIRRNYTNPMQIERFLTLFNELLLELSSLEKYVRTQMDTIFHPTVSDEFVDSRLVPIKEHLRKLKSDCELQLAQGVRPYPSIGRLSIGNI